MFRIRIPGGSENQGAVSAPFTVTVRPVAPASLAVPRGGVTVGSTIG